MAETRIGNRRVLRGTVVSVSMEKTAVVEVASLKAHPAYKKRVRSSNRYYAHDEENQCAVGDVVTIAETRPLSRLKRWRLIEIVEKAK